MAYHDAWQWQREAAEAVRAGEDEALAVLQHPPIYTFGRRVCREHLLLDAAEIARRGATIVGSDRGGDVTFHGPGQLVAYPILDLRRRNLAAADYVRMLEDVMLKTAGAFGLEADRQLGHPGVWVDGAKLGAIGLRVQGGVSTHGLALNVDPDLTWFDAIVPCGLSGVTVTSLAHLLRESPSIESVESALLAAFEGVFESDLAPTDAWSRFAPLRERLADTPSEARPEVVAHGR